MQKRAKSRRRSTEDQEGKKRTGEKDERRGGNMRDERGKQRSGAGLSPSSFACIPSSPFILFPLYSYSP
jgi:hypothetical protein